LRLCQISGSKHNLCVFFSTGLGCCCETGPRTGSIFYLRIWVCFAKAATARPGQHTGHVSTNYCLLLCCVMQTCIAKGLSKLALFDYGWWIIMSSSSCFSILYCSRDLSDQCKAGVSFYPAFMQGLILASTTFCGRPVHVNSL